MKKKQNILLEAATAYYGKLDENQKLLSGMLEDKVFDEVRDLFENDAEVRLHESLWQKSPELKSISLGRGGPGMFGKASEPFGRLVRAIDSFGQAEVNSVYEKLSSLVDAADDVLPFLEAEELVVQREAKTLLAKLFMVINNMFKITTEKAKELRTKLPAGFDIEEALVAMRNKAKADVARAAEPSPEETSAKKPGFFSKLLGKLSGTRE